MNEEALERARVAIDIAVYNLTVVINNTRGNVNDLQDLLNALERGLIAIERIAPTEADDEQD